MINLEFSKRLLAGNGPLELNIKLGIEPGKVLALYGPSGSGKTSVIRIIAGLMKPDSGRIADNDEIWFDASSGINLKPQQRNLGVVFQDASLFPHMTVRDNIAYALQSGIDSHVVDDILEFMELKELASKKPELLSGGQKQRVALARAIVRRPKLLLLDEPTSAMDTSLRLKMQDYIAKVYREFKMTVVLVSHDILEVTRLGDQVAVIDNGKVIRTGKPNDVLPIKELKDAINKLGTGL